MLTLIDWETASFHWLEVGPVLHLDDLCYGCHIAKGICLCHDRLGCDLVDDVLDEFLPLHGLVAIDVNLLKQFNQAMDQFHLLVLGAWYFGDHQLDIVRKL